MIVRYISPMAHLAVAADYDAMDGLALENFPAIYVIN